MKKLILIVLIALTAFCQAQTFTTVGGNSCRAPYNAQDSIRFVASGFLPNSYIELEYTTNYASSNTSDGASCDPCEGSLIWLQTDATGSASFVFNNNPNADYIATQNANGWLTVFTYLNGNTRVTVSDTVITTNKFAARQFVQNQQTQWHSTPVVLIFGNGNSTTTTTTTTTTVVTKTETTTVKTVGKKKGQK